MNVPTTVARLACNERTARRVADALGEALDPDETACAAFEDDREQWHVAVHFRHQPDEDAIRALIALNSSDALAQTTIFAAVPARDWVKESLDGLKPVHAGRFVVHGAHDRQQIRSNETGIEIEAALAFGTGHHGTTRGCLLALDTLAKTIARRGPLSVLDVGTGSGVLAIAAAKAFPARIVASDIDKLAVDAARGNAALNHARGIRFVHAAGVTRRALRIGAPYDLIFANILLGPLVRMAQPLAQLAAPGGHVVLSGLLPAHGIAALAAYRAQGLKLVRRIPLEGWMTLVLRR